MAKRHGARQQKRIAKQKAKRQEKRSSLARRTSADPTVRLQRVASWPVVDAFVSANLWDEGIGYAVVAREEPEGGIVFASFLVDVFCLGIKDAFWRPDTRESFREYIHELDQIQSMRHVNPACLAKIVLGAVEFAQSLGLPPHPDYRHASHLLDGIDPSACREQFTFGKDGRPFYFQGPNETPGQVAAILQRVREAGGHYIIVGSGIDQDELLGIEQAPDEDEDEDEADEEDDGPRRSRWRWPDPGPGGSR
jgi:hypothetical protein